MAPILTFTTEEAWKHGPGARAASVHLERFPEVPAEWVDAACERDWNRLLEVRREASKALEAARTQGRSAAELEAAVSIAAPPRRAPGPLLTRRRGAAADAADRLAGRVGARGADAAVRHESQASAGRRRRRLARRAGRRSARGAGSWSDQVGAAADHPALCERCAPVIRTLGRAG